MAGTIVVSPSAQTNKEFKSLVLLKKIKYKEGEEMCETIFLLQSVNCTTAAIISGGCSRETEQSLTIQRLCWLQSWLVAIQTSHPAFLIQQSLISALSCYCHSLHATISFPHHHTSCWPDLYAELLYTTVSSSFLSILNICLVLAACTF